MTEQKTPFGVFVAAYKDEDYQLLQRVIDKERLAHCFERVAEGVNILEVLADKINSKDQSFKPGLILLGLNDPDQKGYEVLKHLKSDPRYRKIPVVVLADPLDQTIFTSYDWGANSFIPMPKTFDECLQLVHSIRDYWLKVVQLPKLG